MSAPCFLLDEHIPYALALGLHRIEPEIQILKVGRPGAPAIRTPDPDLLLWIEAHGCLLVTNNRASMPVHLHDHLTSGHHILGSLIDELHLIWLASLPGEYQDRIIYLPIS